MHVITRVLGEEARFVWHKESRLPEGTDAVIVPGGFSYGDYLRSGAIAAQAAIMDAVRAFAANRGPVLGICNGFQILCEAGLLPGALARNLSLRFECKHVYVRVEGKPTPFTSAIPAGRVLRPSPRSQPSPRSSRPRAAPAAAAPVGGRGAEAPRAGGTA
jgi:phosphoribosylformylglycinamidine synthase subunit PurQ / glutaminase